MINANRSTIMVRAWAIFRTSYNYPAVPFLSIGRACFASALRRAWAEVREAAELATTSTDTLARLVADHAGQLQELRYSGWGMHVDRRAPVIRAAMRPLQAELARRAPELAIAA